MNDDMRRLFAEHTKIDGPPMSVTSGDLAKHGRRRLVGRNLGMATGLTAIVALGMVGVLTLPSAFASTTGQAANQGNTDQAEQPEFPLPDDLPEPPEKYFWGGFATAQGDEVSSDAADAYGDAFRDWFDENRDTPIEDWPGMAIKYRVLMTKAEAETVGEPFPFYGIVNEEAEEAVQYGGERYHTGLRVYPRGNFKKGDGDTYEHLYTCEDGVYENDQPEYLDYTCDEKVAPNGDKYAMITKKHTGRDKTIELEYRVVLFRQDGTAVEVRSVVDGGGSSVDSEPKLSLDELLDLALSMPDDVVTD